jgi:hypothetical protein
MTPGSRPKRSRLRIALTVAAVGVLVIVGGASAYATFLNHIQALDREGRCNGRLGNQRIKAMSFDGTRVAASPARVRTGIEESSECR